MLIDASYGGAAGAEFEHQQGPMQEVLAAANARNIPVFEAVMPNRYDTDPSLVAYRRSENWLRFEKGSADAFADTNIADELKARGITDIIVMGFHQAVCVRQTTESAIDAGSSPTTASCRCSLGRGSPAAVETLFSVVVNCTSRRALVLRESKSDS